MPDYMDVAQFCARFGICRKTAERWRRQGVGPPFVKLSPRRYIYRVADCEQWLAGRVNRVDTRD